MPCPLTALNPTEGAASARLGAHGFRSGRLRPVDRRRCRWPACSRGGDSYPSTSRRPQPAKASGVLRPSKERRGACEGSSDEEEGLYKYKLVVAYDGGGYSGWQTQGGGVPTVQLFLEEALCKITQDSRRTLRLSAAGRTDAGVHAQGQVACFSTNRTFDDAGKLRASLNSLLPQDIRVYEAMRVPPDFSARYCAIGKVYRYNIRAAPVADPCTRHLELHIPWGLNVDAMAEASEVFVGTHNFTCFSNNPSTGRDGINPVKTIRRVEMVQGPGGLIAFEVEGSGFLYKMVRHIIGSLIAVGSGKLRKEDLAEAVAKGEDGERGGQYRGWNIAEARGLSLQQVFYPPHSDPSRLMLPQLLHDEHGRIVQQDIEWVEQSDGSFSPETPNRPPA